MSKRRRRDFCEEFTVWHFATKIAGVIFVTPWMLSRFSELRDPKTARRCILCSMTLWNAIHWENKKRLWNHQKWSETRITAFESDFTKRRFVDTFFIKTQQILSGKQLGYSPIFKKLPWVDFSFVYAFENYYTVLLWWSVFSQLVAGVSNWRPRFKRSFRAGWRCSTPNLYFDFFRYCRSALAYERPKVTVFRVRFSEMWFYIYFFIVFRELQDRRFNICTTRPDCVQQHGQNGNSRRCYY